MGKRSVTVEVTAKQRAVLEPLTRAKVAPQRVRRWRVRWTGASAALVDAENEGANGKDLEKLNLGVLEDNERCGAPPKFTPEEVASIIALACEPPSESGLPVSHWTPPELTREAMKRGIVESISPRQVDRFLARRTCDTYRGAPELAAVGTHVVSTDEKTGMQALERLHETKRVRPGLVERVEFEYIRHGTLSFIVNFDVATGKVICPSIGPTRTEADFAVHIDKTVVQPHEGRRHRRPTRGLWSVHWLGLVERANLAPRCEIPPLLREAGELIAILMSSAKTAGSGESR